MSIIGILFVGGLLFFSIAVKEYQLQSKRFPVAGWKQAVRDCLQADLDIKSGRAAEETAVELLIMKYAA